MGIEVDADYGETNSSFFLSCLMVEELAKIDPAVSVMCDVQNTLIVTLFRKYGTPQQRAEYLPKLAENMVFKLMFLVLYVYCNNDNFFSRMVVFVLFFLIFDSCAHHLNCYFYFFKGGLG